MNCVWCGDEMEELMPKDKPGVFAHKIYRRRGCSVFAYGPNTGWGFWFSNMIFYTTDEMIRLKKLGAFQ